MIRIGLVVSVALSLALSTLAAPPKTKKGEAKTLSAGDEVVFKLLGDETKGEPKAEKVGLVRENSLLLPSLVVNIYGDREEAANVTAINHYRAAILDVDRIGMDQLVQAGTVFPLSSGSRHSVLEVTRRNPRGDYKGPWKLYNFIAASKPDATVRARVLDGPNKGKICEVPVRNLTEAPKEGKTEPADRPAA